MKPRIALYLLALLVLLGVLLTRPKSVDFIRGLLVSARLIAPLGNETDPSRAPMLEYYDRTDHLVPPGATILIGDSVVQQAPWRGPCLANRGIGGERSDQLLANIRRWPSLGRAGAVVVSIGTNDVWQQRPQGLRARVSAILARIEAPTYLLGLSAKVEGIAAANRELRLACRTGCTFVEPVDALLDDGIHLAPAGYAELERQLPLRCASEAS